MKRSLDLQLDVRCEFGPYPDIADAREIASEPRERELCILLKFDSDTDLDGPARRYIDVIREQWTLLENPAA